MSSVIQYIHDWVSHRPNGVTVIFGERYLHAKMQDGFRLCTYCGMLEQMRTQFASCPDPSCKVCYCSSECLNLDLNRHAGTHQTVESVKHHDPAKDTFATPHNRPAHTTKIQIH